jgi:alpha,alpha-trehalase
MKRFIFSLIIALISIAVFAQGSNQPPDKVYGKLFRDIQLLPVFADSKTFVDCTPKRNPDEIVKDYMALGKDSILKEALVDFVKQNFIVPVDVHSNYQTGKSEVVESHIKGLWNVLKRNPDKYVTGSSLLPLPYSYVVPGGRFREVYYWDSYFTMLGLRENNEWKLIEGMIKNFSYLIQTYKHIPNGNRTYYLSRSQPPYFCLMLELLAEKKDNRVYAEYLSSLQKEYDYWMDKTVETKHVVKMPDGSLLNRYYDTDSVPRQESFREDYKLALSKYKKSDNGNETEMFSHFFRELRSGAESGWDFSSRWFADGQNINTIQTTNIVPVDLNGLIYKMEQTLAKAYLITGNKVQYNLYLQKAKARKNALNKYCWNEKEKWYMDYNIATRRCSRELTAAGFSPLFFNIASKKQADEATKTLVDKFLKVGGIVSTLKNTGQQWDAPNGWAPLQWIAVKGLVNYNQKLVARRVAQRWIKLNIDVYNRTGKLMEKYNVMNTGLEAGGGEYAGQDGFGWTNGVLLKLIALYGK